MEWSTPITAKRRDVIYRVFGQNGLIETGKPTLAEGRTIQNRCSRHTSLGRRAAGRRTARKAPQSGRQTAPSICLSGAQLPSLGVRNGTTDELRSRYSAALYGAGRSGDEQGVQPGELL